MFSISLGGFTYGSSFKIWGYNHLISYCDLHKRGRTFDLTVAFAVKIGEMFSSFDIMVD